jgi:hypothetical protein
MHGAMKNEQLLFYPIVKTSKKQYMANFPLFNLPFQASQSNLR